MSISIYLGCVRKSTESEFIEAVLFRGYIQDFNPVSPAAATRQLELPY